MRGMLNQDTVAQGGSFNQLQVAYMLGIENSHLRALHQQIENENNFLKEENARLKEQLQLAQSHRFGKKTETGEPIVDSKTIVVAAHQRKKGSKSCGRTMDTSHLPRHVIHHDLSDENKICHGCSNPLHFINKESSEQVELLPLRLYAVEHIRYTYGCRHCQTIQMAPKPLSPIPKALAGASLLTEILVNKYQYHLPLYRQSKMLASYQLTVPDNTIGNWVSKIGTGLMKLYEALWAVLLADRYLQVDETPVKVLKPEKTGYLWSYFAPHIGGGIVIFEMSLTRSGEIAEKRLAMFQGLLQTDGYQGYQNLRRRNKIVGLGCLTHARRKFAEVLKVTKNPDGIAAQAIEKLKPVYALEKKMREANLNFHTRKRLRQKIAWPLLKDFHRWLKKQLPSVPPKSALGSAISYTLRQWPYLIMYLRHGMAEIDTNWVENQIRDIAIGKKNWLFIQHKDSGTIHALFYSLVLSCLLNNLNPRLYLHYVMTQIHDLRTGKIDPRILLPHTIDRNQLQIFSTEQIELGKQILNSF
jgi:transposase